MPYDFLTPEYAEHVYAGILGKMVGVYLGRPFEGWTRERIERELGEITGYVHERLGQPLIVSDDDLSGTFGFLRAIEDHRYDPDLGSAQIGETWRNALIEGKTVLWWGGVGASTEHTAYRRLMAGVEAPRSGSIELNSKTVAEQIGAQIFIEGWAMLHPGDPDAAASLARRAARVSHDGEAIHGAVVVAAMAAAAFEESDPARLVEIGLARIPAGSLIAGLIRDLQRWHAEGLDWRAAYDRLEPVYGYGCYGGGCHMIPNHGLVILALLWGAGDFDLSMTIVNTLGWDTDCNAANVGCVLGIAKGLRAFEATDWRGPVADRLFVVTAEGGCSLTDAIRVTDAVVDAAHRMRGLGPAERPRFHWSYPGAIQGWRGDLAWTVDGLRVDGSAETPTWLDAEEEARTGGYGLVVSPTLYPGQTVRLELSGTGRPFVRGLGEPVYGPELTGSGEWTIPEIGEPVRSFGFEGRATLRSVDWRGTPRTTLPLGGRTWAHSLDRFESGNALWIAKNAGVGLAALGDRTWEAQRVSTWIEPRFAAAGGLILRFQGMRRHYAFLLGAEGEVRIERVHGARTVLATGRFDWRFQKRYEIVAEATGDRLTLTIDGSRVLEARDGTFAGGGVGVLVEEGTYGFGLLKVEPL